MCLCTSGIDSGMCVKFPSVSFVNKELSRLEFMNKLYPTLKT